MSRAVRALALALATAALASLAWVFARRIGWPYDLEWMEGGALCHSLRILQHHSIYAPPSLDFIPYLYTPLYPLIIAGLAKLFGLGYALGRAVSIASFGGACLLGYVFCRRETGSRAAALCAMALPAAAFVPLGAWYDLARPDSLFLLLTTAGLFIGWWGRASNGGPVAAALLLVAAFFTKQTASPFMIALGLALLVVDWRRALVYGATLAVVGLPLIFWMRHSTGGWFWTYVFELHQKHDFYPGRAFVGSPVRLVLLFGPSLLLVPWALLRARSPGLVYASFIGATGAAAACLGFGTQWAFTNAFIPGVFFPSVAIGVAAGRLIESDAPRLRPAVVWTLLAVGLVLAPGGLLPSVQKIAPRDWALLADGRTPPTGYDPRPYLPTKADRERGDRLLDRLRSTTGDVLIPFHPFYGYLAGKPTFLHRMGVLDVGRAGLGAPRGLVEAIRSHRWSLVVMDDRIEGTWFWWPGLQKEYPRVETIVGARVFSGAMTEPRYALQPMLEREP